MSEAILINFSDFVASAVNPSDDKINTSLLHDLLQIIVNQLRLSSSLIEIHNLGSAAIENQITDYKQCHGFEINEFDTEKEVDDASGNVVICRKEIERTVSDETTKIFMIQHSESYLNSGNSMSNRNSQEFAAENQRIIVNEEERFEAINLEITRLNESIEKIQVKEEENLKNVRNEFDSVIISLNDKVNNLLNEMNKFNCKCIEEGYEESLFETFLGKLATKLDEMTSTFQTETEALRNRFEESSGEIRNDLTLLDNSVIEQIEVLKTELDNAKLQSQEIMEKKEDKSLIAEMKKQLQQTINELDNKIENVDCKKPMAAGVAKRCFKNFQCLSCGTNVIQIEPKSPVYTTLRPSNDDGSSTTSPKRSAGGNHTILLPRERIFRIEDRQA
ncbi:CLUMA_CG018498, isoform A [Clunio marinus]|uniref:CLUMA_CG018498, isoform A n=1 Tax=Clunio marinus TaxID=568069 RepID=A0A1J1J2D4_9DIPT|nr:CLUMA_CG018498, isoform A [Clunio marinus]